MFHKGEESPKYPIMAIHDMHRELSKISEAAAAERQARAAAEPGEADDPTQKALLIQAPDDGIKSKLKAYLAGKLMGLFNSGMEPCSATTGLYIFDPYWKIYTCWDSVGMLGHQTGSYSEEGPVLNSLNAQWLDRSPATIEQCKDCKYALLHFGGCASLPVSCRGTLFAPACYDFQDNFIYVAQKFFRQGLEKALEQPTLPAVMQEASTAAEAGMAGD
jgi:radical SAM protein with 4Fe4S-binding SPASM domain